jgi:hypothetical protein
MSGRTFPLNNACVSESGHCFDLNFCHVSRQNFVLNIVETQLIDDLSNPDGTLTGIGSQIRILNIFFLGVFVIELLMNLAANWWRRFLRSPWNILDVAMVTSGLLSTLSLHLVVLRLLRIARVLRIFGKVRVLREIISALASSLIPMASAFFILVIMMCMCEYKVVFFLGYTFFIPFSDEERLAAQMRFWASPSTAIWRRTRLASSTAPSSPCSESQQGIRGSTGCRQSCRTAI